MEGKKINNRPLIFRNKNLNTKTNFKSDEIDYSKTRISRLEVGGCKYENSINSLQKSMTLSNTKLDQEAVLSSFSSISIRKNHQNNKNIFNNFKKYNEDNMENKKDSIFQIPEKYKSISGELNYKYFNFFLKLYVDIHTLICIELMNNIKNTGKFSIFLNNL